MRIEELDLRELLEFDPKGGVIRFGGQRAIILDAAAWGLLRKELIQTLGFAGARGLLTRFGFAHGWRTAESLQAKFPWDSEEEWRIAGGRLHMLQGLLRFEPVAHDPKSGAEPFAQAVWRESYEAEQHLLHLGLANEPVCWTLCGFASGYLTYGNRREIYCIEERCMARGDAACFMVGRSREEWGDVITPYLPYYHKDCLEEALKQVTEALKRTERRLRTRRQELARTVRVREEPSGTVASSEEMKRVLDLARRAAKVDSTVLLTGETGVGKEMLARLIHDESLRAAGPFVAINCAAVPDNLLESELFGYVRGAFTGATQDRFGLFEAAHRGTLFLDEIGEVSPLMQVKLLRALQEREIRRIGENRSRPVDVRIVAATNRNLTEEVAASRFRQDLYYRLRVVELHVPPLRQRREDILPLARLFLADATRRLGRRISGFTPQAADQLLRYDWPGNVREIQNAIERGIVLTDKDRIGVEDLPEEIRFAPPGAFVSERVRSLDEVERDYILAVLRANDGSQAKTAQQLKIGTATLYRKLKQYGRRT